MDGYADRLLNAIADKGTPCIVGLDPRIDQMPLFTKNSGSSSSTYEETVHDSIMAYHRCVVDAVADMIPAIKIQSAFFEQYGIGGMRAFYDTIHYAKKKGLMVIADAKRGDIGSTAQAYANAFLSGETNGEPDKRALADCLTISPYLGKDSIDPFIKTCMKYGTGVSILVKTTNPGSADVQNLTLSDGKKVHEHVAEMVNSYSSENPGANGYSSIGAVVGATFPEEARKLRKMMPHAIFLVPGYGHQGGSAKNAALCFNNDGLGAVVSASRSITYDFKSLDIAEEKCVSEIRLKTEAMISDINAAIKR